MIALLIVAAAANPVGDRMFAARDTYKACVLSETLTFGSSNQEPADTVLRAVRSRCEPQWANLQLAFPGGVGGGYETMRVQTLEAWRRQAEDAAIAALLEARPHRP
jgi:hypothetical protein